MLGHLMPNLPTTAPSAIMCIVTLNHKEPNCIGRSESDGVHSICAESYDCEWTDLPIPNSTFAVIFYAQHHYVSKLIDVVVFSNHSLGKSDAERKQLDGVAREVAARLAPPIFHSEKERRERPFQVFGLEDCNDGCRLRQSKMALKTFGQ